MSSFSRRRFVRRVRVRGVNAARLGLRGLSDDQDFWAEYLSSHSDVVVVRTGVYRFYWECSPLFVFN